MQERLGFQRLPAENDLVADAAENLVAGLSSQLGDLP